MSNKKLAKYLADYIDYDFPSGVLPQEDNNEELYKTILQGLNAFESINDLEE